MNFNYRIGLIFMLEITKPLFICEKCEKEFPTRNQCIEHEKICGNDRFDIYRYELVWSDNSHIPPEIILRITKYKAKYNELNIINLIPTGCSSSDRFVNEQDLNFDKVQYYKSSDIFYIYTKDISIENEELCIEKLFKYANDFYWKKENALREKRRELAQTYDLDRFIIKDDGYVNDVNFYYV